MTTPDANARRLRARAGLALVAALAGVAVAGCSPGPVGVATLSSQGLLSGLVAHWTFDEGLGAIAHDSSGNGRDGAISGNGWSWVPGNFGGALSFGGADQFGGGDQVTVGGFPPAAESFTVSAWIFVASTSLGPTVSPIGALMSNESLGGGGWAVNLSFAPPPGTTSNYDFVYSLGPNAPQGYAYAECRCFTPGSWVHLAGVVQGGTSMTFYVNGVVQAQLATANGISPGFPTLYLGRWPGQGRFLTGTLDDVAIWNRALAAEEIGLLDTAPVPGVM